MSARETKTDTKKILKVILIWKRSAIAMPNKPACESVSPK